MIKMPDIVYYKNKMDAWGPDDNGNIKNLYLYKQYKTKYEELAGIKEPVKTEKAKPKKQELDLDGDGDFDKDDKRIAAKVLASKFKKKSKK